MRIFRRRPAPAPAPPPVFYSRSVAKPDPRIAAVEAMQRDYFLADALAVDMASDGNGDGARFQSGVAHGVARSIASALGKDLIDVQCTLERGNSPLTWGTLGFVPEGYADPYAHIADLAERLEARRRDALKADGHPLYVIKYAPERIR